MPCGVERAVQGRIENRTVVDRHDRVAVGRGEADAQFAIAAAAGMDGDAPPPGAVRIDQRRRPRIRCRHVQAYRPRSGVSRRDRPRAANAGWRSRRSRRNIDRTAGSAPRWRDRSATAAGGRDDRRPAATSTVSPPSAYGTNTVSPLGQGDAVAAVADMIDDEMLVPALATARADEEFDVAVAARDR